MRLGTRVVLFVGLTGGVWAADAFVQDAVVPNVSTRNAVAALNGGDAEAQRLRAGEDLKNVATGGAGVLTLAAAALCFGGIGKKSAPAR